MFGFVSSLWPERNYGFIAYSAQQDAIDPPLDESAWFHAEALHEYVERGDRVSFDIEEVDGRVRAVNISQANDRLHGFVDNADEREFNRHQFCFIQSDDGRRLFCAFDDIAPDVIGRRALSLGVPVSFRLGPDKSGRNERAVNVRSEDPALAEIDPLTYREFGRVETFNGDNGYIRRPCGDTLGFLAKNIITEGVEEICRGLWLEYRIVTQPYRFREDIGRFRHTVFACDIAVTRREERQPVPEAEREPTSTAYIVPGSFEELFLNAPELPLDESKPPLKKVGAIYTPAERQMTIRELIAKSKAAA